MASAGRREFELLMKLQAALGPNFNSTFQTAMSTTKKLQDSLSSIKKVQGDISAYKKTQEAIAATKSSVKGLEERHSGLQQKLTATVQKEKDLQKALAESSKATGKDTEEYKQLEAELKKTQDQKEKLSSQVKRTAAEIENSTKKIGEQENKLSGLSDKLKTAGVNTEKLASENDKLQDAYDRVKRSQENIARANQSITERKEAISATKAELTKTIGAVAAVGAAFAVPIKGAMEFESSMAEVSKVVDWIGTGNNATADQIKQYNELSDGLYGLTRQIPMTAQEFAEITAAAGQANVARDNAGLLEFASDAAKMGIAFDTTAEQAGDWMAKWRSSFSLTQEEVVALSDKINYLGNNSAANAGQISAIVTKIGPLGEVAGLASGEIAALGATLTGVGVNEDVAATGIKKVMTSMTAGTAATKRQKAVLKELGISATDLAERMQTDARGAIMDFLGAIQQLPEAEQAASLKNYFGEESVGAIAPLLTRLDDLRTNFNSVGDAAIYAGSMEAEYAARAETSENQLSLLKNAVKELSDTFGKIFVPGAENGVQALTDIIYKVTDFVKENPELIKTLVKVSAGLAGLNIAGQAGKLGFEYIGLGVDVAKKSFALFRGDLATTTATALTSGGKMAGAMGALKNIGSIFGGLFGKAMPLIAIISALSILFLKIKGEDISGFIEPLKQAFEEIKPVLATAMEQFKTLGETLMPTLIEMAKEFAPILGNLVTAILPVVKSLIENIVPLIVSIAEKILPAIMNVIKAIVPLLAQIITAILPVAAQLIEAILPTITTLAETVLPIIAGVLEAVIPMISNLVEAVLPVLAGLLEGLMPVIQTVAELFGTALGGAIEAVKPIIESIMGILSGIIDFIVGVFTGDWGKAWNAVVGVFKGIINIIPTIVEGVINAAIAIINGIISGINAISSAIGLGEIGLIQNVALPRFEKGTERTPDTFIAGDVNGKGGELIAGAKGRKVFTAAETTEILDNINRARAINDVIPFISRSETLPQNVGSSMNTGGLLINLQDILTARKQESMNAPTLPAWEPRSEAPITILIEQTINIDGNAPDDIEEKLSRNNENLLRQMEERLRRRAEDEKRMAYG